ncbi:ArdC family protein [Oscillatoria laete-virens NRMC-F 0139]|nr:ArdC family protein [Oscillatoria laete-virens]MDL5051996.1 ArdC family protein [Oscillatoria laete-virens NRMC-F 0139]
MAKKPKRITQTGEEESMQYIGKAVDVAATIIEAFQSGNLPKAMAPIFIRRKDGVPCRSWSWGNQLLCVIYGTSDARGIRQWNECGRWVKKGSKAFDILVPLLKPATVIDEETKQEKRVEVLVGFKTAPVFAVETTDGKELPKADDEVIQWINALPLVDVARAWGLKVEAFNGQNGKALGHFCKDQAIGLGVKNLSTWAHELIHAADNRLGNLTEKGQHWRSETVAELGGAILLECLGYSGESDRGGCWDYVAHYAEEAGLQPIQACMNVLKRTCDAVELILTEAGKISLQQPIEHAAV